MSELVDLNTVLAKHAAWLRGEAAGERVNLRGADLVNAKLVNANLAYADLVDADLRGADLVNVNLTYANLRGADLRGADLEGANLENADLEGAKLPYFQICPEEGAFVAYKKADGAVVTLEIPADAKRTSTLVGRKCRASKAKVLAISGGLECVPSNYDHRFVYRVGETVEVADFNGDIRVECTRGIHFWMTKREAQEW